MLDEKLDAIMVGTDVTDTVVGRVIAQAELDILATEHGNSTGSENMIGGRLYAHSLGHIMSGFTRGAPLERKVTRGKIPSLIEESAVTLDFRREKADAPTQDSYTVSRSKLDPWLMDKAKQAGVQFIPGVRVDTLIHESNKVTGVQVGNSILEASIVILADDVNSMPGCPLGMVPPSPAHYYAVGVKELIGLPPMVVADRFSLSDDEGVVWLLVGSPSDGLMGGGFLYTNQDSISLDLACGLGDIAHATKNISQTLEGLKRYPAIWPLIAGGELLEYPAHMVPEDGLAMVLELIDDNVTIVGGAAGFCLSLDLTVRDMDLAIASAGVAAQTAIAARGYQDFSASSLTDYKRTLEQGYVMCDLQHSRKISALMGNPWLPTQYLRMMTDIMSDMFTIDRRPNQPVRKMIMSHAKRIGLLNLLKDGIRGVTTL